MNYSPSKVILYFFVIVILSGALLLSLPWARTNPGDLSVLTNLFMSTSSVCVTGLTVVDLGSYYTLFGQLIILLLIQIGGLGYMTLSTIIGMLLGRIALKERAMIKEILDVSSFTGLLSLLQKIMVIVFLIEGAGAVILTAYFSQRVPFGRALYLGIFHSVSGFCNAGLSTFKDNLEGFAASPVVLLTIGGLIIMGGLGFPVLVEVWEILRKRIERVSLHSRIVLIATAVLLIGGMVGFWVIESNNTLQGRSIGYSALNSFFQSVTARTAGFDSIAIGLCNKATAILLIVLMFIGASPGGTGGGIKTTTFVIVVLFLGMMIHQRDSVNIRERQISKIRSIKR
jgi:trk system potassium uptake protein TrkH